jgi:DNA-binding NarL/FixJ family response regulator
MITQTTHRTRLVLADRRPRVRFALRTLLERQPGIEVVGEAMNAETLVAHLMRAHPDVLLLDWRLEAKATAGLVAALRRCCPNLYLIVLSGRPEERREALAAGVDAFVSKMDPPNRLLETVQRVKRTEAALIDLSVCTQ